MKKEIYPGVAGGTASGKTTVCNMIISQLHDQRVVLVNQVNLLISLSLYNFIFISKFGFFFQISKDSFYRSLNEEQLKKAHEYNFDHPGKASKAKFSNLIVLFFIN